MRLPSIAIAATLGLLGPGLNAQWINYPTPGIPRLPNGKQTRSLRHLGVGG